MLLIKLDNNSIITNTIYFTQDNIESQAWTNEWKQQRVDDGYIAIENIDTLPEPLDISSGKGYNLKYANNEFEFEFYDIPMTSDQKISSLEETVLMLMTQVAQLKTGGAS